MKQRRLTPVNSRSNHQSFYSKSRKGNIILTFSLCSSPLPPHLTIFPLKTMPRIKSVTVCFDLSNSHWSVEGWARENVQLYALLRAIMCLIMHAIICAIMCAATREIRCTTTPAVLSGTRRAVLCASGSRTNCWLPTFLFPHPSAQGRFHSVRGSIP